jgi:hypothetical protein
MLVFFLGVLLGILFGGTLCVTYLRQEIAAGIGPRLKQVELQLDTIESQLSLAIATRHAELSAYSRGVPRQLPKDDNQ